MPEDLVAYRKLIQLVVKKADDERLSLLEKSGIWMRNCPQHKAIRREEIDAELGRRALSTEQSHDLAGHIWRSRDG